MNIKFTSISPAVVLGSILALTLGVLIYTTGSQPAAVEVKTDPNATATQTQSITLSIEGMYKEKEIALQTGETLLLLLERLDRMDPQLQLVTKTYDMGTLIESMAGLSNGTDDTYWLFTIDGETPMIGAHGLVLRPGQNVEWQFKTSEY